MSFLLGHSCDILTTSLFLVPAGNGRTVDAIEVHRRIGLRRMRPSTPLALLSVATPPECVPPGDMTLFEPIDGPSSEDPARAFLLRGFSSQPLPDLDVVRDGSVVTLVLPGAMFVRMPLQISSAFRIRNAWSLGEEPPVKALRGYTLHMACRQVVRDVFIEESLFPGAVPLVSFALPAPRASTPPPREDGTLHFTEVGLERTIEPLTMGPNVHAVPGVPDQSAAIRHVLERSGHGGTRFRGWRCSMTYPVSLVEMLVWLKHPREHVA